MKIPGKFLDRHQSGHLTAQKRITYSARDSTKLAIYQLRGSLRLGRSETIQIMRYAFVGITKSTGLRRRGQSSSKL